MTTAIITARGGSTRTPRKNVAMVAGLPLVAWSVIQALNSHKIDEVYLTTDDDEIADIGAKHGATIIRRPVLDNGITAGVVFADAVEKIEKKKGHRLDTLVTILPTSPCRKPDHFDNMISAYNVGTPMPVTTAIPQKETFIFSNTEKFQDRFATRDPSRAFFAKQLIGDKFWNYCRLVGGDSVASRDFFMATWAHNPAKDIDIDTSPINIDVLWKFLAMEEWQGFDVDYPADLEMVRIMMERFITTPEVYYTYGKNVHL